MFIFFCITKLKYVHEGQYYFGISEILWAKDMSLAVIVSADDFSNTQAGTITILPIDGTVPAIETPFKGYGLQWEQAVE